MELAHYLATTLALDLEVNADGHIYALGAVLDGRTLAFSGRFDLRHALAELDRLASSAERLLGHNLLDHDLPVLRALAPNLVLLHKPVVDTLFLSPLAFPENPYHRLVKDYKLVREALNDPLADARTALRLFADQWAAFAALGRSDPDLLGLYRYCLEAALPQGAFGELFGHLGAPPLQAVGAFNTLSRQLEGRACAARFREVVVRYLPDPEKRAALAYAVAWLRVAGGNSVLPPWVHRRFPEVTPVLRQLRDVPCDSPACRWCRTSHDAPAQLQRWFGFPAFRHEPPAPDGSSLQQAIVRHGMADRPLLAILPTGGGKSLCYQLPALVRNERRGVLTVVITPLQALMKDQVDNLRNRTGAPGAAALYGLLTAPERRQVLDGVRLGDVSLLYVSPEQLRNHSFRTAIAHREVGAWVFDEAHCLSKWGHDFRPDYLYAARFIKEFAAEQQQGLPPVQCFTATAKLDVREEIRDHFRRELGQELTLFEGGVERTNLHFEVQTVGKAEKYPRLHALLTERLGEKGSAVVYLATQKGTEAAADYLTRQGWEAAAFHAGLPAPHKRQVQEAFIGGSLRVICATNAFGMGIDKEDVRLVVHADIPGSLENYLQEAGRAGRDRAEADCVLLYDEQDIETQFKLGALSELTQRDIAQILRGLRSAKRNKEGDVVITTGELLRSERVETSFDTDDRNADTKVITAVAWLERAGFLERNENHTRVFQGRPRVKDLEEAKRRIADLGLSQYQQQRWLAIVDALMNAADDEGFSADELAGLAEPAGRPEPPADGLSDGERLLRTLHDMAEAGLIQKSLLLSAYVRHKVKNSSKELLERACTLERALLALLPEEAPDAGNGEWQSLSLRHVNQRLLDRGHASSPEDLRLLLQGLARDGQGLAGRRGSIDLRHAGRDQYRVKLQRDWDALRATAEKRQKVAAVALAAILDRIPADAPASAERLVEFAAEELLDALRRDIELAGDLKDPLAALDRALLFLHELRVITLQKGLAVFRQAMTIRVHPEQKGRRYGKGDYAPLAHHYGERVFQVHVMNEYARRGLEKVGQALALVMAYFTLERSAFVRRWFVGREEMLERATGQESFRRIVEDLGNPVQQAIVGADEADNLLVLAGPGSGKSRVVVHRCAFLLRVRRVPADAILVLCFNRNAATALRRRLTELVGNDARGVTVQTYHGLALRLTGRSLVDRSDGIDFDALLQEAVDLLQGRREQPGLAPDELRERLLAGYRHILVDEYQDIDERQYQLISALAGRTLDDPERRLGIMAVGDDDQNIYQFRGTNVAFIRRFQDDYRATAHYLVENYRSSGHIIAAANALIARNADRMKTDRPITVNRGRADLDGGGRWARLDPLARGRVQCLRTGHAAHQAAALAAELQRLRQLDPAVRWSRCAVLARDHAVLQGVRAALEQAAIPVSLGVPPDQSPPPTRVRELRRLLLALKERREDLLRTGALLALLEGLRGSEPDNDWWRLARTTLEAWRQESADAETPVAQSLEYLYETLAEQRAERRLGSGVFLGTAHAAKGLEFDHVFIPDGGWERARAADLEEERRLYYVAMTRARETLCLCERTDLRNPHTRLLSGDFLLRRDAPSAAELPAVVPVGYALLGLRDLDLGFAGRFGAEAPVHGALAALRTGDELTIGEEHGRVPLYRGAVAVAALSKAAVGQWRERLGAIRQVRVIALVTRTAEDGEESYRGLCRVGAWEVPMVEIVLTNTGAWQVRQ